MHAPTPLHRARLQGVEPKRGLERGSRGTRLAVRREGSAEGDVCPREGGIELSEQTRDCERRAMLAALDRRERELVEIPPILVVLLEFFVRRRRRCVARLRARKGSGGRALIAGDRKGI